MLSFSETKMSFENKNSYTKILVNDDMEVANKPTDLNRSSFTSDKSDGIKENNTILDKNLENGKEPKREKSNGIKTIDSNTKENVLSGYGFSKVYARNYNFLKGFSNLI